jgi:uncharacterized protein
MAAIRRVFWNSDERRLRAFWRLLLQILIFLPLQLIIGAGVGVLMMGWLLITGGISPDQLGDWGRVQALVMGSPLLNLLLMLSTALAMTLSVWIAGRFLDRRRFSGFGFHLDRAWWLDFGFGLALGALLMALVFLIQLAAGWVVVTGTFVVREPGAGFVPALLVPLVLFLAVGFYEELFSRGYQLQNLAEGMGRFGPRGAIVAATLLSSAVFGILHALNPNANVLSTLNLILAGILLAAGYVLTGELAIPIGLHITWNFFQANVFGFPVSGADFRSATFIAIEQRGPALWTGGAFGPEGGLLGLGIMALGLLLTVLWVRRRRGEMDLHLPLAESPVRAEEVV